MPHNRIDHVKTLMKGRTLNAGERGAITTVKLAELTGDSVSDLLKLSRRGYFAPAKEGLYKASDAINGWFKHYRETKDGPILVDKDELSRLTGLGDSMHRKLATKGYFPPPRTGLYDLRATFAGMVRYLREHLQRRDQTMDERRGRKLDLEISLLEIEKATKDTTLVSVDEVVARLSPAVTAMRHRILASTLTDQERDELIDDLGRLLCDALKQHESAPGISQAAAANSDSAAAAHSQPVGG